MLTRNRLALVVLLLSVGVCAWAQTGAKRGKPVGEADLVRFLELGIDNDSLITNVKRNGVSFPLDQAARQRLQGAGASDELLTTIETAAKGSTAAPGKATLITFDDVLKLVSAGLDEEKIKQRLGATTFQISAVDEQKLKDAGASDELIALMKKSRGEADAEISAFAIVVDCSASMQEPTKEGPSKMEAAKKVLAQLIEGLPEDLQVTLVLYGNRRTDPCLAAEVVRPLGELGTNGKAQLKQMVARLRPTGATPIALGLSTAGDELAKANAPCGLVLISDGKESCKGDPSAEAAALAQRLPITFGVNVVGFDVKPDEREALEEIAASGNGKYFNAETAAELAEAVQKLKQDLDARTQGPGERDTRKTQFAGKTGKPGAFLHDAGLVDPGEYKGALAMLEAHYYRIPVRKGQELRAIGQIQKTSYQGGNNIVNQTFAITIYDPALSVAARELLKVTGNPTAVQTLRASWTAESDGMAYVGISATDNHGGGGVSNSTVPEHPKPSPYTLRVRLEGEAAEDDVAIDGPPVAKVDAGNGFDEAGELPLPSIVGTDLKLDETAFFKAKVTKGDVLSVSAAVQKPWWHAGNSIIEGTYTLTVYDDDQVKVAEKAVEVKMNPPDAHSVTLSWPVELSGHAYVSVSAQNTGLSIYPTDFKLKPGWLAVQVALEGEGGGAALGRRGADPKAAEVD